MKPVCSPPRPGRPRPAQHRGSPGHGAAPRGRRALQNTQHTGQERRRCLFGRVSAARLAHSCHHQLTEFPPVPPGRKEVGGRPGEAAVAAALVVAGAPSGRPGTCPPLAQEDNCSWSVHNKTNTLNKPFGSFLLIHMTFTLAGLPTAPAGLLPPTPPLSLRTLPSPLPNHPSWHFSQIPDTNKTSVKKPKPIRLILHS